MRYDVRVILLLAAACTRPTVSLPDRESPEDPVDTGVAAEDLPASDAPEPEPFTEQLCQLTLDCPDGLIRDVRTACTLQVRTEAGDVQWDGPASVWIRGRSSASVVKPGYGVELRDEAGEDVGADLLGMGGEADWVIDGLWYDRLLVRDKLGYDLFRSWNDEGRTAESALCELTLNGAYYGVHALVERVERDDDRVDIDDGRESGLAFVLTQLDEDCFYTNTTTYGCWKLVSPDAEAMSPEGAAALTTWLTELEAAITAGDADGIWARVDRDSVIDTILLEEFFKNEDSFYTSMRSWKDTDGKLHFVPWDLDMTFGQFPNYYDYGNPHRWIQYRPPLWVAMAATPGFHDRLAERWAELRAGPLAQDAVFARIDALQAILGPAIERNFTTWPISGIDYAGLFYPVTTYDEEDDHVRAWIELRLAWMDDNVASW